MKAYLRSRIKEGRVDHLACPCCPSGGSGIEEGCSGKAIPEPELKQWLSDDLVEKFQRFTRMRADPQLRACPSCSELCSPSLESDGSLIADMTCQRCGTCFCFYHSNAHARGAEACAEYERKCVRQQLQDASACDLKS